MALSRCCLPPASAAHSRLVIGRQSKVSQKELDLGHLWRPDSIAVREKLSQDGCEYAMDNLWSGSASLGGLMCSLRQLDVIDVCYLSICHQLKLNPVLQETKETVRRLELFCDVSQNVNLSPWSVKRLRCVTTSSRNYSFKLDRLLKPEEVMMAYGWPPEVAEACTQVPAAAMEDLVGETMALQTLGMVMVAMVVAAHSEEAQRQPGIVAGRMGA